MSFNDSFRSSSELLNGRVRSKVNVEACGLRSSKFMDRLIRNIDRDCKIDYQTVINLLDWQAARFNDSFRSSSSIQQFKGRLKAFFEAHDLPIKQIYG